MNSDASVETDSDDAGGRKGKARMNGLGLADCKRLRAYFSSSSSAPSPTLYPRVSALFLS